MRKKNLSTHSPNISVDITDISELRVSGELGVVKREGRLLLEISPRHYRSFVKRLERKGLIVSPVSKGIVKVIANKQSEYNALRKEFQKKYRVHAHTRGMKTHILKKGGIAFPKPSGDTNGDEKKGNRNGNCNK